MTKKPRPPPKKEISNDEFEDLIKSVWECCEGWINGTVAPSQVAIEFKKVKAYHWVTPGTHGLPDDFDWGTLTPNVANEANKIREKFQNAARLMTAIEESLSLIHI